MVSYSIISIGTTNTSMVHPREVYQLAILTDALALIVAHNHPSGNSDSIAADRKITKVLREAGDLLGIQLMDHVIVAEHGVLSLWALDGWCPWHIPYH